MIRKIVRVLTRFMITLIGVVCFTFVLTNWSPNNVFTQFSMGGKPGEMVNSADLMARSGATLPVFYVTISQLTENGIGQYVPSVDFHSQNRFHYWAFGGGQYLNGQTSNGVLRGDFGFSLQSGERISDMIGKRLPLSLILGLFSILVASLMGVLTGCIRLLKKWAWLEVAWHILLAIPEFAMGIFLMVMFSNPDVLDILPTFGISQASGLEYLSYLILPVICYSYTAMSVMGSTTYNLISAELKKDHARVARAKGMDESEVILRHGLRNSLLPIVAMVSQMVPLVFGGSVVIEAIFNLPGLGSAWYVAIVNNDFPVVVCMAFFFGLITVVSYFAADLTYKLIDPRIDD